MKKILTVLALCLLTSNAMFAVYDVKISSFGDYSMKDKQFMILPADGTPISDVEFIQYTRYIAEYLILKGGQEVNELDAADVCILVSYGVGGSKPIMLSRPSFMLADDPSISATTTSPQSSTSAITHNIGIAGYVHSVGSQYRRYIDIYAFDNQSFGAGMHPVMLWKTNIECVGWSSDLRAAFPYMMYAARDYLGVDSKYQVKMTIDDKKERKNVVINEVEEGHLRKASVKGMPKVDKVSPMVETTGVKILAIVPTKNAFNIILNSPEKVGVTLSKYMYIECNGRRYYPFSKKNIKIGKKTQYLMVSFDPLPQSALKFSIKDEHSRKPLNWEGIHIAEPAPQVEEE